MRRAIEDRHSKEDCLVDTWIGDGRSAARAKSCQDGSGSAEHPRFAMRRMRRVPEIRRQVLAVCLCARVCLYLCVCLCL